MNKLIFALIAGAAAMSAAHAQSTPYIGLGVASADHTFNLNGASATNSEGYKASAKIFGGVELTPMFGIEAGYTDIRKSDHSFTVAGVPGTATTDGSRSYLAAKATTPVNEAFSVYGKLGVGYSKINVNSATPLDRKSVV